MVVKRGKLVLVDDVLLRDHDEARRGAVALAPFQATLECLDPDLFLAEAQDDRRRELVERVVIAMEQEAVAALERHVLEKDPAVEGREGFDLATAQGA